MMKHKIQFSKMHGLGNDFIVIDAITHRLEGIDLAILAKQLCNRHFGIGADGLILVLESSKCDSKMRIFNPEGSEAEMCGNGLRCFAKFAYENDIIEKEVFSVETLGGAMVPALILKNGKIEAIEIDMGEPAFQRSKIPMLGPDTDKVINEPISINNREFRITCVSMGNPHAVVFVEDLKTIDIPTLGPLFEKNERFPERVNTEFVQILNRQEAVTIVWERGAGETLACGTGACAVVAAGVLNNLLDRKVMVHLPGGSLPVEWQESDNHIMMSGPAELVFTGQIEI
ncbi:diaminopimelate epimerase [Thermoproteota archaeon]